MIPTPLHDVLSGVINLCVFFAPTLEVFNFHPVGNRFFPRPAGKKFIKCMDGNLLPVPSIYDGLAHSPFPDRPIPNLRLLKKRAKSFRHRKIALDHF
jgi:hypothetical protein